MSLCSHMSGTCNDSLTKLCESRMKSAVKKSRTGKLKCTNCLMVVQNAKLHGGNNVLLPLQNSHICLKVIHLIIALLLRLVTNFRFSGDSFVLHHFYEEVL